MLDLELDIHGNHAAMLIHHMFQDSTTVKGQTVQESLNQDQVVAAVVRVHQVAEEAVPEDQAEAAVVWVHQVAGEAVLEALVAEGVALEDPVAEAVDQV